MLFHIEHDIFWPKLMKIEIREKKFLKKYFSLFSLLFTLHTFLKGFCEGVILGMNDFFQNFFKM